MNKLIAALLFALCGLTLNVQAQTADFVELIPTPYLQKDLTGTVGLGMVTLPKYANGSKQEVLPLPVLDLEWKSGVFFSSVSGYGYNFSHNPSWQYGVRLGLIMDQQQSPSNKDSGPGNTRSDLAPGVFGNYLIDGHYAVLTAITTGGGIGKQHDGTQVSIGGRYINQFDASNSVDVIVSTTWVNLHFMQDYYGVSQAQAVQYNMPEYETSAGMLKVKLALGWNHVINKDWSLQAGGSLTDPLGAASSSPLASSKVQFVGYAALCYSF